MQPFRTKFKNAPPTPLVRQGPADNREFFAFVSSHDGFRAYVRREVLEYIRAEAARAAPDETIGLLAGRVCYDPGTGPYTLVLDADGAHGDEVEASPGYVRITAAGQATVRARLEFANPDREIVGWYHSHPKYEARFSNVDETEQATWADPGHLGIVYSGIDRAEPFGVYRGPHADRLTRLRRPAPHPVPPPSPTGAHPADKPFNKPFVPESAPAYMPPRARGARGARPAALLPWALAMAFVCLTVGIFWLGLRVLALEGKLDNYASNRQSDGAAAQPRSPEAPEVEPPSGEPPAPARDEGGRIEPPMEDEPSLHSPAKTLSPERVPDRGREARDKAKAGAKAKAERAAQARRRAAAAAARVKQSRQPAGTKKTNDAVPGQRPAAKGQGEELKTTNKPPKQL